MSCLLLFTQHDAARRAGVRPRPGDVTVCAACAAVQLYADDGAGGLTTRWPTSDEVVELTGNPLLASLVAQARAHASVAEIIAAGRRTHRRCEEDRLAGSRIVVGGRRRGYTARRGRHAPS